MDNDISRKFVSEEELQEARQKRQAEWKKVLEGGQKPLGLNPEEETYDPRTLYERLQEQKLKKEEAFQEMTRFSNLIHRLDEDEIDFLATLENDERLKELENLEKEQKELEEFRRAAAAADAAVVIIPATQPKLEVKPSISNTSKNPLKRDAQRMILEGAIKRASESNTRKKSWSESDSVIHDRHLDKRVKLQDNPIPLVELKFKKDTTITKESRSSLVSKKSSTASTINPMSQVAENSKNSNSVGASAFSKSTTDSSTNLKLSSSNSNPLASLLVYNYDSSSENNDSD